MTMGRGEAVVVMVAVAGEESRGAVEREVVERKSYEGEKEEASDSAVTGCLWLK